MIVVLENFITEEQEKEIVSNLKPSKVKAGSGRNIVTRYGSKLPYKARVKSHIIPPYFLSICEQIGKVLGYEIPDSVTVNEYMPGQSIDWHTDSLSSGPVIVVLSLISSAEMGLRDNTTKENTTITLNTRSLLVLDGEHRTDWEHCIYPVQSHRFSIVFRKGTYVDI